jgi:hypothetical protein
LIQKKSRPLSTEKCNDDSHKWHAWAKFCLLRMSNSEAMVIDGPWQSGYKYLKKEFTTS